jgi:hypothetical protein
MWLKFRIRILISSRRDLTGVMTQLSHEAGQSLAKQAAWYAAGIHFGRENSLETYVYVLPLSGLFDGHI